MNAPKLRFKEFKDEWQEYKVGEILKISNGINKEKEFFGSGTPIINYMDVNKNELITHSIVRGLVIANSKEIKTYNVKKGDILFTRTSETSDEIGLSSSVIENIDKCIFSGFILKGTQTGNYIHPYFGGYYFRNPKMRKEIIKHSSITTRALTSGSLLTQMLISIPSLNEQEKIGKILLLLDKKIELQSKKIEDLKLFKKGLSTTIFNSLRDFEEYKLGKICNINTGKLDANAMIDNGKYRFYTCAKEYSLIDKYAFDTEALLISGNGAYVGYIHYYKGKFNAYQRTYVLDNFSQNIQFIKCYLEENLAKRINSEKKEGNTPYIVLSTLSDMVIKIPSKENQIKISNIINCHNKKIELEENKLLKLQELKKGLMQSMFV